MSSERSDAARNRQRILVVAKQLFAEGRLHETSMQDIARTAEVGHGTLYRRFADKGELCEALFGDDLEVFWKRTEAYLKDKAGRPALSRLEWLLAEKIRFIDTHLPLFLASHEVAGTRRYENFKKDHRVWACGWVARLLDEARASGEAEVADIAFATDAILASFAPPLLAYQRQELGYSLERIIAGVTHVFIDGLRRSAPSGSTASHGAVTGIG